MKKLLLSLILYLPVLAIASNPQPTIGNANINNTASIAGAISIAAAKANAASLAAQEQNSTVNNKVGQTQGNKQQITFEGSVTPSKTKVYNTPDPALSNVYPTAPCMGGTTAGVSAPGVGVAFGTSWTSEECQIGETARGFEQAGYKEDALVIRCQSEYAAMAPSCQKLKQEGKLTLPKKHNP